MLRRISSLRRVLRFGMLSVLRWSTHRAISRWRNPRLDFPRHRLDAPYALVAKLLCGSGLRLFECLKLGVQALSSTREPGAKGHQGRSTPHPNSQAGLRAHLSPQLRQPFVAGELRPSHHSGIAGTQRRVHDDDLYPHGAEHHPERGEESAGFVAAFPSTLWTDRYARELMHRTSASHKSSTD